MAVADYFNRAATAASQVLQGFELEKFQSMLSGQVIGLAFDAAAAGSLEGIASLELSVRLVARLYPAIAILPIDDPAEKLVSRLTRLARSINPKITVSKLPAGVSYCVVVGDSVPDLAARKLFIGSDGWLAKFSSNVPVGSRNSGNPFGAGASACIGAANLFRAVFRELLPNAEIDDDVTFSLFDYIPQSSANPLLEKLELAETFLIGLGAVGNGAVWALSRVHCLRGVLNLVDPEEVELSNLQRYVLASQKDVGRTKTVLAASFFKGSSLRLVEHASTWQSLAAGQRPMEQVAVALDTAADRIALQGALPRWIVNAWTQRGDLGVSQHRFVDESACLACLYLPDGAVKDQDEIIAAALGLSDLKTEVVRPLLHSRAPVDESLVAQIAVRLGIPKEPLLPLIGKPLQSFYSEAICGGIVFEVSEGAQPVQVEVPMAFQSAMAGIMLAAELVKHAGRKSQPLWTTAKLNLLRPFSVLSTAEKRKKDRLGRCICQDPDYINAFHAKYGQAAPTASDH